MERPKTPQALVGSIVRSKREPDRLGRIEAIGIESDRPFVRWAGNSKPIASEWACLEKMDFAPYAYAIGMSVSQFEHGFRQVTDCGLSSAELLANVKQAFDHAQ